MHLNFARHTIRPFLDYLDIDPLDDMNDYKRLTRQVTVSLIRFDRHSFTIMMGTDPKHTNAQREATCREYMPRLVSALRDAGYEVDTDLFGDPSRLAIVNLNRRPTQ